MGVTSSPCCRLGLAQGRHLLNLQIHKPPKSHATRFPRPSALCRDPVHGRGANSAAITSNPSTFTSTRSLSRHNFPLRLHRSSLGGLQAFPEQLPQQQQCYLARQHIVRASSVSGGSPSERHNGAEAGFDYDYDLFTIGAGSGGVRAARFSAQMGAKVGVCELPFAPISSDSTGGVGGTCVLRGCVPKKLLVYGSHFHEAFKDSEGFGWSFPAEPVHDWPTLIANKNKELARLIGVYKSLLKNAGVDLIEGRGKLVDAHTVEVAGKRITARNILVATGGRAFVPDLPGKEWVITSDHALDLAARPEKIVIVGAGYIALEFACIFNSLGSEVHVIYRGDKVLRGFDEEIRTFLHEQLVLQGITFHFNANPTAVEKGPDGKLAVTSQGAAPIAGCDQVMFATGRKPNVGNLGLEEAGVNLNRKGAIEVDEYSRTSMPSVWAVGDVTDRINLTPVALMEGMALSKTLFGGTPTRVDHVNVPSAVFTQPPVGTVGLSEAQAEAQFGDIDVYTSSFRPMKATLSGNPVRTFMKIIVDAATDRVVGVHVCGEDAGETIQGIGIAVKMGATKAQFDATIGVHPTAAEELVTMRTPTRRVRVKDKEAAATVAV